MTTTTTAFDRLIDTLRGAGSAVTVNGDKATAQCPSHDDGRASLSVGPRRDHKGVVLFCHAGCQTNDIVAALGLPMTDLFDDPRMRAAYNGHNVYDYPDGRKVHRKPGKKFHQSGNRQGTSLFHADRITADTSTVYVPEGEKDVLAAESVGAVAVCSAMGAGKAHKADWSPLRDKHVIIVADKDEAGRRHASQIVDALDGARLVRVVEAAVGNDLADHIAAGRSLDELEPVDGITPPKHAATAQPHSSQPVPALARLPRILDAVADEVRSRGLVGEERLARTCTWCSPPGCSTSRYPPGSRVIPHRASPTPSRR